MAIQYAVDIVICIDKTGSMAPVLDMVKNRALQFETDLKNKLAEKQKIVDQLRVRVIAYGDCYVDGAGWLKQTEFLDLPAKSDQFRSFVGELRPDGGGDEPENGLEALALAIKSHWTSEGLKRRHVIAIWTDASAHPLEVSKDKAVGHYPADVPRDFDQLKDLWDSQVIHQAAKRLVMFAPEAYPWNEISTHWEEAVHLVSVAGSGLGDVDYSVILDTIANSV